MESKACYTFQDYESGLCAPAQVGQPIAAATTTATTAPPLSEVTSFGGMESDIFKVYEELGGHVGLKTWAEKNPQQFYSTLLKTAAQVKVPMAPAQVVFNFGGNLLQPTDGDRGLTIDAPSAEVVTLSAKP